MRKWHNAVGCPPLHYIAEDKTTKLYGYINQLSITKLVILINIVATNTLVKLWQTEDLLWIISGEIIEAEIPFLKIDL